MKVICNLQNGTFRNIAFLFFYLRYMFFFINHRVGTEDVPLILFFCRLGGTTRPQRTNLDF